MKMEKIYTDVVFAELPGFIAKVGEIDEDIAQGESYTSVYEVSGDELVDHLRKADEETRRKFCAKVFPSAHCQHEHDCCANWYPSQGRLVAADETFGNLLVMQGWGLNV